MKNTNFYCQNKCTPEDFSIDEWNKAFDYCIENNIPEEQMNEILDGKNCKEQCFDCMAVIGNRRIKTQAIIDKMYAKALIIDGVVVPKGTVCGYCKGTGWDSYPNHDTTPRPCPECQP